MAGSMKRIGIIICICNLMFLDVGQAQELNESNVAGAVVNAFKSKYPNIYVYEWEWKRKLALYEAEFRLNGRKAEAFYTADGKWVKTKIELEDEELPAVIAENIHKGSYAGWEIDDVNELSTPENARFYEVELKSGKRKVYQYFTPDGQQLQQP